MPELEEKDLYAALGLESPDDSTAEQSDENEAGEKEQEAAEPAEASEENDDADESEDQEEAGEKEQEVAEPASKEKKKEPQSDEQRRQAAAARRQKEIEEAVQNALAQERARQKAEDDAFFAKANLKNPLKDNAPISNREEYLEYQKAYEDQRIDRELKAGKLSRETIEAVVANSPQMQDMEQIRRQSQQAEAQRQLQAQQQLINEQLAQIKAIDPEVESILDLANDPKTGQEFQNLVHNNGLSFVQAYVLTHQDQIASRQAASAARRTETNLRGKEHLRKTGGQSGTTAPISSDELQMYRTLLPELKTSEIEAWVAKQRNK